MVSFPHMRPRSGRPAYTIENLEVVLADIGASVRWDPVARRVVLSVPGTPAGVELDRLVYECRARGLGIRKGMAKCYLEAIACTVRRKL